MTDSIIMTLLVNTAVFSVLFGLFMLARIKLKKHMSPAVLLALWAVVVIKLVVPFGFEAGISIIPAVPERAYTADAADDYMPGALPSAYNAYAQDSSVSRPASQTATNKPVQTTENSLSGAQKITTVKPARLSWQEAALCIWTVGALITGAVLCLSAANLKRCALHARMRTPVRVRRVFEECGKSLSITRKVDIAVQSALLSPMIMGALRPVLVLPENAPRLNERSLRHIMTHELVHLKRGDLWAIRMMNVLGAIYWFNPLVKLCFKYIREDMETACDHRVIETLGQNSRLHYISTVLQYAGHAKPDRLAAAMGLADGRPAMEKRIKGMFGITRTGAKGRITAVCIALLMLAGAFMTACQPTPEKPFVQSKNNDTVQQAINSSVPGNSAEIHKFSAPATWQSAVKDEAKNIDINVDASVIAPTDTWGLYELVPQRPDRAYLDAVLKALIGDSQIYGKDTYKSREELEADLVRLKGQLERAKDMKTDPEKGDKDLEKIKGETANKGEDVQLVFIDLVAELEKEISNVEKALLNAPDKQTTQRVPIDLGLLFDDTPDVPEVNNKGLEFGMPSVSVYKETGEVYIHGFADTGKEEPAWVYLYRMPDGEVNVKIQNAGAGNTGGFTGKEPLTEEPLFKVNMTEEQAAGVARKAVNDMGFGYLDIAAVHKMSIYDKARMEGDRMPECYAFTFNRSLDGVTAAYAYSSGIIDEQKQEYARSWKASEVLIGVDDSGVVFAQINVPYSSVNQLASGVELKSFDEIMEIFNKQAAIEGCFSSIGLQELIVGRSVDVDEIRLGYMPTIWKDHTDQFIFVPVWDFFGSETTTYDENYPDKGHSDLYASLDENYQRTDDLGEKAILTINALDGTIMQRIPGPDW